MLNAAVLTHTGRVRSHNEDASVLRPAQGLFAVIDGMGGEAAGEVAAAIAAAAITETSNLPRLAGETLLAQALQAARERILHEADTNPACHAMGAVATAIRFDDHGRSISIGHVGDSRAWRINAKGVVQLTEDHVAAAPDPGRSRPAVTRDLGRRDLEGPWVATRRVPVAPGDLLVLASDGLHDPVGAEELAAELTRLHATQADAEAVCARLVALALARGGPDNVTVLAVRVGRFRRGGRLGLRRLGWPGTILVLAILLALVGIGSQVRRGRQAGVPTKITGDVLLAREATYPTGALTELAADASLTVRGAEITGEAWTIRLAPGSELTLDRAVLSLTGPLTVELSEGATFRGTDLRVSAPVVRLNGQAGTVRWAHVALPPTVEAQATIELHEEDVRTLGGAPAPPAPAPSAAPAP